MAFFAQMSYSSAVIENSGVRTGIEAVVVFNPPDREASTFTGSFAALTDILIWYRFSLEDRTDEAQLTLCPSALR